MMSEAEVQSRIMMEAAKYGIILWRNNSGAGKFVDEETGNTSHVRFGLGNISKQQNSRFKSSDLIGIMPKMFWFENKIGYVESRTFGIFIAVEVKKEGWKYNPNDEREVAQKAYIDYVIARGGVAGFCASVVDFLKVIGRA